MPHYRLSHLSLDIIIIIMIQLNVATTIEHGTAQPRINHHESQRKYDFTSYEASTHIHRHIVANKRKSHTERETNRFSIEVLYI